MGTLPELQIENDETKLYKGVEGISVELIDAPSNPYRIMCEVATATWGSETYETKWNIISPENRFFVVKSALSGFTLPQAIEPLMFSFIVRAVSRSAFDQHARARLQTFFSQGCRDNSRIQAGLRIPTEFWPENGGDPELFNEIVSYAKEFKRLYKKILEKGAGSFQDARILFPLGATHNYKFATNLGALKSYIGQRAMVCEQADTVAVALLVWWTINKKFPLIASHLKPTCDAAKKCVYHQYSHLSEAFGALFKGCGRWPDEKPYYTFNKSCSSYDELNQQLGIHFPSPSEWKEYTKYEDLDESDKKLFNE